MKRKVWTHLEENLLRLRYANALSRDLALLFECSIAQVYGKAKRMGLSKDAAFVLTTNRELGAHLAVSGADFRYPKGHIPANKGKRTPGYAPGRMAETQFKPGRRPRLPIGGHRVDPEGFLMRRVTDTGYNDWKLEHRLLWEEARGPIPKGHKLAFRDGNRAHVALDNLELVTDAENMRRNSFRNNYPAEVVEAIALSAQLSRAIKRRERRGEKQDVGSARPPVRDTGTTERRRESPGA